jgi:hypothetical protein
VEVDSVMAAASDALADQGYSVRAPKDGQTADSLVGWRAIDGEWSGEIRLIPPNVQEDDLVVTTRLLPPIRC